MAKPIKLTRKHYAIAFVLSLSIRNYSAKRNAIN